MKQPGSPLSRLVRSAYRHTVVVAVLSAVISHPIPARADTTPRETAAERKARERRHAAAVARAERTMSELTAELPAFTNKTLRAAIIDLDGTMIDTGLWPLARPTAREAFGIVLIVAGVVLLLWAH